MALSRGFGHIGPPPPHPPYRGEAAVCVCVTDTYSQQDLQSWAQHLYVLVVQETPGDGDDVMVVRGHVRVQHRRHQATGAVLHPPGAVERCVERHQEVPVLNRQNQTRREMCVSGWTAAERESDEQNWENWEAPSSNDAPKARMTWFEGQSRKKIDLDSEVWEKHITEACCVICVNKLEGLVLRKLNLINFLQQSSLLRSCPGEAFCLTHFLRVPAQTINSRINDWCLFHLSSLLPITCAGSDKASGSAGH